MSRKTYIPSISPAQCRAARGLLAWSREALATASGVPHRTIASFELSIHKPHATTINRLIAAFNAAGVELTPPTEGAGAGVRLSDPDVEGLQPQLDTTAEMVAA